MAKKLFYLPLEPYIERYTYFMSSVDGWAERNFKKHNVTYVRVDGETLGDSINTGKVLDANGRCYFALSQMQKLVKLINDGEVKDDDVIYVEDFWHPGIESLFYIRHLTGIKFKIGTFLHAQSVDNSDFAYDMREWIRPLEQGYGKGNQDSRSFRQTFDLPCYRAQQTGRGSSPRRSRWWEYYPK